MTTLRKFKTLTPIGRLRNHIDYCDFQIVVCNATNGRLKPHYFLNQLIVAKNKLKQLEVNVKDDGNKRLENFKNPCYKIPLVSLNEALRRFGNADEGFLEEEHKKRDGRIANKEYVRDKSKWSGTECYYWGKKYCYIAFINQYRDPAVTEYPFKYIVETNGFHDEFKILLDEYKAFSFQKNDYYKKKQKKGGRF